MLALGDFVGCWGYGKNYVVKPKGFAFTVEESGVSGIFAQMCPWYGERF